MAFKVGDLVALRADRKRVGPVLEILTPIGSISRYRVFHGNADFAVYAEDQLIQVIQESTEQAVVRALAERQWLTTPEFRARLTSARLSNPQTDALYALHAARIKFIPFQFKPLLRFLAADQPRILIADEVGVGKTIEAGLILKELNARRNLRRVLILCPKALTSKWRAELRRFDENFTVLSADTLMHCLKETHLEGEWPEQFGRAIVNLELFRQTEYLDGTKNMIGLANLSPPPQFDLVILDEAHHVRNTTTSSHRLLRYLCDNADGVVFLSATPVHVGSVNLFSLLSLLRPDQFLDQSTFYEMVEPNTYILEAMRYVRAGDQTANWSLSAAEALRKAIATSWGKRILEPDPRFSSCLQKLESSSVSALSADERIRCLRDLEETHTLAHLVNRTRRRDIGEFTVRDPKTVEVEFTPQQKQLYDKIIEFRKQLLLLKYHPRIVALISDMLQRQAASCLPALLSFLDSFLRTGRFITSAVSDGFDEDDEGVDFDNNLVELADEIRTLAAALPADDPKLDTLVSKIAKPTMEGEPGKLLIFSFFLHTLEYLRKNLAAQGYRVAVITGKTPDFDRDQLRARFRLPRNDTNAIDILLSSEVGCEGLDYEFCDRLVNYDIPWNPMRLEQRIGRIDRFGQKSPKVLIFNFVTPGTVDHRIFYRCYERLDIFRHTLGDLEEVLGDLVPELTKTAVDPNLTNAEQEARVKQLLDNAIRVAEEYRRLESDRENIVGLDQLLFEELDALQADGRTVSPHDIEHMVRFFIALQEIQGTLTEDQEKIWQLKVNKQGKASIATLLHGHTKTFYAQQDSAFLRWLDSEEPSISLTFDQDTAVRERSLPFVTAVHPLARAAVEYWQTSSDALLVSSVLLPKDDVEPGRYIFVCDLWQYVCANRETRLVGAAWNIDKKVIVPDMSKRLISHIGGLLPNANVTGASRTDIESALHGLDADLDSRRRLELERMIAVNELVRARRSASISAFFSRRLERLQSEIAQMKEPKIKRMKESEQSRIERELSTKLRQLDETAQCDITTKRIAAGVIEVVRS
jgi:superfamily II DNA or RNA helicase